MICIQFFTIKLLFMKKKIVAILAVLLFSNSLIFAQEKDSVVTLPEITITGSSKVSNELGKAFHKTFPDAKQLRWYKVDQDYLAKFIKNDMDHNALFKKNGYLKYDISYGHEKDLPEETRKMIQSAYADYNITGAINVKSAGREIWVVHLEGLKNYVTVRVEEQEMEEVQRFVKSS